jgi:uncharacterized membrane protein YraQ (UPF0718 family)
MSLWLIILLSVVATILVGIIIGWLAWKTFDKVDDAVDAKQEALLPLYSQFARAGVKGWFLELLGYMISGNEEMIYASVKQLVTAENTPEFFDTNIAAPIAKYWAAKEADKAKAAQEAVAKLIADAEVAKAKAAADAAAAKKTATV